MRFRESKKTYLNPSIGSSDIDCNSLINTLAEVDIGSGIFLISYLIGIENNKKLNLEKLLENLVILKAFFTYFLILL